MARILWADDEIDLLKPHVMFLENKGHELTTVQSGNEAIDAVKEEDFEIIFLDENMPGLTGLETLDHIKAEKPSIPIVMITKSEEESIMDSAIGGRINDYLIKPVNPNQILLSIKKNLEGKRLVNEKTTSSYQQKFRELSMDLQDRLDYEGWIDIYKRLVYWEIQFDKSDQSMMEVLQMQKNEANQLFSKYVANNYTDWFKGEGPIMSHTLLKEKVFPKINNGKTFLMVIDNLRLDQWQVIKPILMERFTTKEESLYYSILPTATQYARNALFAGMMPAEIQKHFPSKWKNEDDEGSKNKFEEDFLAANLANNNLTCKTSYNKITNLDAGKKLVSNFNNLLNNDFNVIVYNFVDMLSHARTDMEVIRELADDESAYRSLTLSWFNHSSLNDLFKLIAKHNCDVIITTDHGTIKVNEPSKVVGDRNTNSNLRYKQGKNLNYNNKDVLAIRNPEDAFLPRLNVSSTYLFAKEAKFFVYPNNYNYYVNYFKNTFQHGGISMEEMIIPFVHLSSK
ncbi:MAG: PglZ domain-containing protein [Parvicellaceae bacterium]